MASHFENKNDGDDLTEDGESKGIRSVRTATDLQRFKLEKLLKQPDKPVFIPGRPKERKMPKPPEFIRNTWGSSAGAGSGDFHVYRGVRRREYARQKFLDEQESKNSKDSEYQQKMEENTKVADERTAKKRAKRLKKKQKTKQQKKSQTTKQESDSESEEEESIEKDADLDSNSVQQKEAITEESEGGKSISHIETTKDNENTAPTDSDNPS